MATTSTTTRPWAALWALLVGFFMILVDSTIVSVATPTLMTDLHADIDSTIWATSAYLLAYAVPLLVTGRLGDRFGPKNVYLVGLAIFTIASLFCGLARELPTLILFRVVQGLGAALLAPQTMAVVTRIFAPDRRGPAMALWGTVGGVGALVGPQLGGLLVGSVGWQWIFFVNVPIGIVGFVVAMKLVPALPVSSHRFDLLGVALSGIAMFCIVFGVQEGDRWALIAVGVAVLIAFVGWQARNHSEPLLPLSLFRDRNFSLGTAAMAAMGFAITCMSLPLMLYAQNARGYSPAQAALLLLPLAVTMASVAPLVGRLLQRGASSRTLAAFGFACTLVGLGWLGMILEPRVALWQLELPIALVGLGNGFIGAPLSSTAIRNLPMHLAGAGSGAFNAIRQMGAVLGSASIAALMQRRVAAELAGGIGGYARAMGESMFLPAGVLVIGLICALGFSRV